MLGMQLAHYRITQYIAKGGMSEVYQAEDTRNGQHVAIKIMSVQTGTYGIGTDRDIARTFEREMKAITSLKHPRILPLRDYGDTIVNRTRFLYLVMPLCPDGSLADWIKQRRSPILSSEEVTHLIYQAAEALQHAHDNNVLHRDVKPHNFLISGTRKYPNLPYLLLADFGIAKFMTPSASLTRGNSGTSYYMAPERWDHQLVKDNKPVPATDQYSLAVMAYHLLTGRLPFLGATDIELMDQHLKEWPPPPSKLNSHLSLDVDWVLFKALAKKPEERFKRIEAFARALGYALDETTIPSPPIRSHPVGDDVTLKPPIHRNSPIRDVRTQQAPRGKNITRTLTISKAEAKTGIRGVIKLPEGRTVEVQIPADVEDGWTIRINDEGEATPDGVRGDLIVIIKVENK